MSTENTQKQIKTEKKNDFVWILWVVNDDQIKNQDE